MVTRFCAGTRTLRDSLFHSLDMLSVERYLIRLSKSHDSDSTCEGESANQPGCPIVLMGKIIRKQGILVLKKWLVASLLE
jgi:hypothetical protein